VAVQRGVSAYFFVSALDEQLRLEPMRVYIINHELFFISVLSPKMLILAEPRGLGCTSNDR
jgi:hypothetical protein